jgi:phage terminase large subunit-like protein
MTAAAIEDLSPDEVRLLIANCHKLPPDAQRRAIELLKRRQLGYRSNRFMDACCPQLTEKGRLLLSYRHREVLFGGAAGSSKTQNLLASAIQYCDIPGYSALILRRTFAELSLGAKSLMARARQWFNGLDGVRWSDREKSWVFSNPGGDAYVTFGYLQNEGDELRYQGAEFQFVGFDELGQIREEQYKYLFSRTRRIAGTDIPIRIWSTSNPGSEWVKERFVTEQYVDANEETRFSRLWIKSGECGECSGTGTDSYGGECVYCEGKRWTTRYFLPARMKDNLYLDQNEYRRSLVNLSPVVRAQLESGDWDVVDEGKFFQRDWLLHYRMRGTSFILRDSHVVDGQERAHDRIIPGGETTTFITGDTASKLNTWNDFTVFMVWTMSHRTYDLMLRHAWRARIEIPDQMPRLKEIYRGDWTDQNGERGGDNWPCRFAIIEEASSGIALVQEAHTIRGDGITVVPYSPNISGPRSGKGAKFDRATVPQQRMKAGQIWVPAGAPGWLSNVLREWLEFDGSDEKHDDCVDNLSMAADYAASGHNMQRKTQNDAPRVIMPGMSLPPRII